VWKLWDTPLSYHFAVARRLDRKRMRQGRLELTEVGNLRGIDVLWDGIVCVEVLEIWFCEFCWNVLAVQPKQASKKILRKEGIGK